MADDMLFHTKKGDVAVQHENFPYKKSGAAKGKGGHFHTCTVDRAGSLLSMWPSQHETNNSTPRGAMPELDHAHKVGSFNHEYQKSGAMRAKGETFTTGTKDHLWTLPK
ncbi:hypothetical protein CYMTET_22567 [Cymbomonas tetramitiformis]|uniref:Uncharacterized protein n=1 Tax=Cymbomonas tetramitiformis TaxID=36881 RepID=A0AAE0FZM5_9CHLO|nr:hypothetical protein CYMTET_22567 [Cymbomonas tetramitiformis]